MSYLFVKINVKGHEKCIFRIPSSFIRDIKMYHVEEGYFMLVIDYDANNINADEIVSKSGIKEFVVQ